MTAKSRPPFDLAANDGYAPTPVQQEFLKLVSQAHWYVCLGDTSHALPQLHAFACNENTLRAFADGGKKKYMLEKGAYQQPYYDQLANPKLPETAAVQFGRSKYGAGDIKEDERLALRDAFEAAAKKTPELPFTAIDNKRQGMPWIKLLNRVQATPKNNALQKIAQKIRAISYKANRFTAPLAMAAQMFLRFLPWGVTMGVCRLVRGKFDKTCYKIAGIFARDPVKSFVNIVGRNKGVARTVRKIDEPAVILFGSAHFTNFDNSLSRLLSSGKKARTTCVMPIFLDAAQKKDYDAVWQKNAKIAYGPDGAGKVDAITKGDANLYLQPTATCPHGIEILNPALQPLYETAVRNVLAKTVKEPVKGPA